MIEKISMFFLIFIFVTVSVFGQHDAHEHGSAEMKELFSAFPTLSEIHWIMLTPDGQSAGEIEVDKTFIPING